MRDVKIVETTRLGVLGVEQGVSAALVPLPIPEAMVERAQNAFLAARNAVQEAEERRLGAVVTIFNYEWIRAALTAALTPEGA
jgi:hypothetical protein